MIVGRFSFGALLLSFALTTSALLGEGRADASVSVAVSFDALVLASDAVVLATPMEEHAQMEDGRIFTYTRLHVDSGVAGDAGTGADVYVRTFGGVIDHVGMSAEGEPTFAVGKQQLLFLRHGQVGGTYNVTADAQGQFVVIKDDKVHDTRFRKSRSIGMLLQPRNAVAALDKVGQATSQSVRVTSTPALASDVIESRTTAEVTRDIASAFKRLHASR